MNSVSSHLLLWIGAALLHLESAHEGAVFGGFESEEVAREFDERVARHVVPGERQRPSRAPEPPDERPPSAPSPRWSLQAQGGFRRPGVAPPSTTRRGRSCTSVRGPSRGGLQREAEQRPPQQPQSTPR